MNAELVVDTLRRAGPMRVTEIVEATGLSRPTVEDIADGLRDAGWLTESLLEPGLRRGRPARELAFRAEGGAVLGVDVGVRRATAIVADLRGRTRGEAVVELAPALPAADRLRRVRGAVTAALRAAGLPRTALMRAAVASPGVVDVRTGTVTRCDTLPGWSGLALGTALRRSVGCPVAVDNDANLAAVGERWRGVARGVDDVVFLLAGDRLGAGIVVGGAVVRGHAGAAGEMAFTSLFDTDPGAEGIGAVARLAGREALARRAASPDDDEARSLRAASGDGPHDAELLLAAARRGDAAAAQRLEKILARVAGAVAVLGILLDPELVVLGGEVAGAAEEMLEPLRRRVAEMAGQPVRLAASSLGPSAVAVGAVRQALVAARAEVVDRPAPVAPRA
jgi:predicted NBD/HSP70 family sugar kinase